MLKAGYLKDTLDSGQLDHLKTVIAGEQKKEQLVSDIGRMVSTFNSIGQIAKNLGVGGDLVPALSMASNMGGIVSNVVSGNYLGAIVSVTGLFGGGAPDPEPARHAQLMAYLEKRFDQMDKQLTEIIQGQRKIIEILGKLSEQMALYDAALHDRLDRMEFKLDTIQDTARNILFSPLVDCDTVMGNIKKGTGLKNGHQFTISNLKDAKKVADAASFESIDKCVTYLQGLYKHAFDPNKLELESLAFRLFKNTAASITNQMNDQKKEFYAKTNVQNYYNLYKLSQEFVLPSSISVGAPSPNNAHSLSLLSMPAHSTSSFEQKLRNWESAPSSNCSKDTKLGEVLVGLLCTRPESSLRASRLTLPQVANRDDERYASDHAGKILGAPLTQDPIPYLADLSLFFAPVYDLLDLSSSKVMTTLDEIVANAGDEAKGTRLLPGALQVVTVGVAQLNLLHGDLTSKLIFDLLWKKDILKDCKPTVTEPCTERFYTVDELSKPLSALPDDVSKTLAKRRNQAYELLKYNNLYLQRNVLMYALTRTCLLKGDGQHLAYQYGLDALNKTSIDPEGQLASIFDRGIHFSTVWEPSKAPAIEKGCAEKNEKKEGCIGTPVAQFLNLTVPLPTKEEFRDRELIYPPLMRQLLAVQNKIERRLAEYSVLDWATRNEAEPEKTKALLMQSLLIANHN